MSRRFLSLTVSLCLLLILILSITFPMLDLAQAEANSQTTPVGIPISRHNDGLIQNNTMGVFGPQICTMFGDPFSPWNSPYTPDVAGSYTYRYQIRIPTDYPDDVIRVELFDPDSVNKSENEFTMERTQFAIAEGQSPSDTRFCGEGEKIYDSPRPMQALQRNPCAFETGELDLVASGEAVFDQINPFWYVRVDENRGVGPGNGDGTCNPYNQDPIPDYEPRYNTQTLFELYYYRQTTDGQPVEVPIASYIGNTEDERDDAAQGFHQTDLRWVSPGADKQGYDYPIADVPGVSEVPTTEEGTSFEVRLADISNIVVDPVTGARLLYLDVTALSGASENVYHIWAGPDDYVDTSATDGNLRNLAALDNPGSHDSLGVQVEAISRLTANNFYNNVIDMPIGDFSAEDAGGTIYVNTFDLDSGANPPLTFYFDSIDRSDWSMTFSDPGVNDPDGVADGVRCEVGGYPGCDDAWTSPAYQIEIPGDMSNCDFQNPNQADCTPFAGGRLMVDLIAGQYDTHAWEVIADLSATIDPTQSCAAFPIAVHNGVRSVTPPGEGQTPYPDANEFDYPTLPPAYSDFAGHTPNIAFDQAKEGDLFYLNNGFGSGNFGWLLWNTGKPDNAATLADSLTWPGDSLDYADHGDTAIHPAAVLYPYIVRGFVGYGDATDINMNLGDWIAANTGNVNSVSVRDALEALIDTEPILRLIVWDEGDDSSFSRYRIQRFGLFKIIGFKISQSNGGSWLLLEFMGFDDSCGQLPVQTDYDLTISSLGVVDPGTIYASEPFTVTATITNNGPDDLSDPVYVDFYFAEPTIDLTPPIVDDSIAGTIVSGLAAGTSKTIVLQTNQGPSQVGSNQLFAQVDTFNYVNETDEANNTSGPFDFQALETPKPDLTINDLQIIDSDSLRQDEPILAQMVVANVGTVDVDEAFVVDVFLNPSQADPFLAGESVGNTAVSSLAANAQKTITITIPGGTSQQFNNALYVIVDLSNSITETDETNNSDELIDFQVLETPKPDLTINDLQIIDSGSLRQDEPILAQMVVANVGTVDVDEQFIVDVFLNPSQADPFLAGESVGNTAVSSLAANSQKTVTITIPDGTSQLLDNALYATVDWSNGITETDETNNMAGPLNFQVLEKPMPDLTITDLQILDLDSLRQDEPILAQMVIANMGTADVDDQFFIDVYLNPSQTNPFLSGESVGFTAVSSLTANSQKTITVTIPGGTNQQFNNALFATVDWSNNFAEADETNNETSLLDFDVLSLEDLIVYLPFVVYKID
ncbi:MAG: hypothetical protein DWQ04_23630 [Chloroflexi bacterium]|nr:MAG: hypothetical protein DWQ04_23630 [Chloroflexota bacterium]